MKQTDNPRKGPKYFHQSLIINANSPPYTN